MVMKYHEITEAPIGNLEVHNMDQPGTFADVDRKLLTNPAHIEKIKKRFDLNSFLFDLYFVNLPDRQFARPVPFPSDDPDDKYKRTHTFTDEWQTALDQSGIIDPDDLRSKFGVNVRPNPEAISVVFISNANEENSIPMTPWMVAHRFAHALYDNIGRTPDKLQDALRKIPDRFRTLAADIPHSNLLTLMTNRSARLAIMGQEYLQEMIAQYLTTGGLVRLAYPKNAPLPPDMTQSQLDKRIKQLGNQMSVLIDRIMDQCVGLVFLAA